MSNITDKEIEKIFKKSLKSLGISYIKIENETIDDLETDHDVYRVDFIVDDRKMDNTSHDDLANLIKKGLSVEGLFLDIADAYPDGTSLYFCKFDIYRK
jgi:hypothetical protein